ncbi:hypothetical protein [Paraburkholderia sp. HD33-4]|uniref:hypothetical protein n=1 Tax=Paraburkholderia sp. HD33-4 TaxID=2883242 RepID=UPI001F46043D|nr:hypothetical protein [Paraburkholderia sp. HD33-4]
MSSQSEHDLSALDKGMEALGGTIRELAEQKTVDALKRIVHKPGWTSVAEYALFAASLDAVQQQAELLKKHCRALVEAAEKVGSK